ncbi:MAG: amylo-alpha-1,6-glucosidase [Candidatus Eisenbacteria bacterium]
MTHEWLVTNGLGGYASGTVGGVITRRYHGLLVSALPAPKGRVVMLSHLSEALRLPDQRVIRISGEESESGWPEIEGAKHLRDFGLEGGLPVWHYAIEGFRIEKRIVMPHFQNTVHVTYRLLEGEGTVRLILTPAVHFRPHEEPVDTPLPGPFSIRVTGDRYEVWMHPDFPPLKIVMVGERGAFTLAAQHIEKVFFRSEKERGYQSSGRLWSPGEFRVDLSSGESATFLSSTETWEEMLALRPAEAQEAEQERRRRLVLAAHPKLRDGFPARLVLAADQFVITPAGRVEDTSRARARGDEVRSVIAGYHWFTDWGRDTMISLEGLTLLTGRSLEAGYILRTFAHYAKDGLIPNHFPEGNNEAIYNTADATLWYFHAIDRYLEATGDRRTLAILLPLLVEIVDAHLRGTRFHIGVDPSDGLLRQGQEGYQLTWMDAKVGDWVVTPRRGKAVEINALWYNALRLLERWIREERGEADAHRYAELADRARDSFRRRFWYAEGGYLYDVVDGEQGDDASFRPNQIFAVSLPHPVLEQERWEPVVRAVQERLLTPVGLRSLAPGDADFKPRYYGDLRSRDAAYHQGTVWAWLIGPFVDAWLRVHPGDREGARRLLEGFPGTLEQAAIGTISEIFDAEAPFTPRGCIAQAWSVAEVLRAWAQTAE